MDDFALLYPHVIAFGWGVRERLPEVIGGLPHGSGSKPLLVCTRALERAGLASSVRSLCGGKQIPCFDHVPHDPPLATVDAIVEMARDRDTDLIVAVGGGSVIDAAKAAAAVAPAGGSTQTYFCGERPLPGNALPLIALPTTAGTGAEITRNAVLTDPATATKKSLRHHSMVPYAALIDPQLTVSLPSATTAATGLDALTQAVESFLSLNAHAVSRPLAADAVRLLLEFLPRACEDGGDMDVRTRVARGSLLSGLAFSQSGLGAVHGLAHPIGLALNTEHGLTCAILLPHILEWNRPAVETKMDQLACHLGLGGGRDMTRKISQLCRRLEVPETFASLGLREEHIDHVVANCRSGSMRANPRHMQDADVRALLRRLCG